MKKRTNSYQIVEKPPTNSIFGVSLANSASQNYLRNLKQSLLGNKAPKTTITTKINKKQETLSSLLKAANIHPLSSRKIGPETPNSHRSLIAQASQAPTQDFASHNLPDNRSCNPRVPKLNEAKLNLFARNNSEPRLTNHVLKHVTIDIQEPTKIPEETPKDHQGSQEKLKSQYTEAQLEKLGSLSGIEFMTTGTSSNDKKQEHVFNSGSVVSNLDSQDSTRKLEQIMPKKASQASTIDMLYESFENNKDYATGSEENDSRYSELCTNHPNKKAKYYTIYEEDPSLQYYLCSKCAVALADKGTKIRKIIASEEELRKSEIEAFLIKLSHSKRNTENINESIQLKKHDFDEFFSKQTEKAEAIASILEQIIKETLNFTQKSLDAQRNQLFETIGSIERQLNANLKEISDMQSDIERNLENILKNIELKPFQKIIGAYHERVQDLDQQLETFRSHKIRVEKLPRVPSKQLQALKVSIQALFERTEQKISMLKKTEAEINQNDGSKKRSNVNSLCVSFENNHAVESVYDPLLENHQRPDRFTFANEKLALKTLKQGERIQGITSETQDIELLNRTLKNVVLERNSQECLEEESTHRNRVKNKQYGNRDYFIHADEQAAKSRPRKSSVPCINQGTEAKAIQKYLSLLDKVNTSQVKKKCSSSQNSRYQNFFEDDEIEEEEEGLKSLRYAELNDSAIHQDVLDCGSYPSSKRLNAKYSSWHNTGFKNEKRQVQSQNNSVNLAEHDLIFPRIIHDQHKSAYCSPNFKENID